MKAGGTSIQLRPQITVVLLPPSSRSWGQQWVKGAVELVEVKKIKSVKSKTEC